MPKNEKINLTSGINLIANPKFETTDTEEALKTLIKGMDYDAVYRYNTTTGLFENVTDTQLQEGAAYFVNVLRDTEWTANRHLGTTTYVYDGDRGRVKKVCAKQYGVGSTETETTTYIGSLFEKQETPSGDKTVNHIYLGGNKVCSISHELSATSCLYFHGDHLGSSNVITDGSGTVIQHIEYDPFGKVILDERSGADGTEYKFTGKELDSNELYYYGARYYDPEICRFIMPDTIIPDYYNPQSLNRYSYCENNPVNYIDPTGHWSWKRALTSFITGVVTGITFAVCLPFLGPVGAAAVAGAVGGATNAALNGADAAGIFQGALTGATMGAGIALGGPILAGIALVGGAIYSTATGGLEGLGYYLIGLAGGFTGYKAGSKFTGNRPSPQKQQQYQRQKNNQNLKIGQKPRAQKIYGRGETGENELKGAMYDGEFYPAKTAKGGEKFYRVFGGAAKQRGQSVTPVDPYTTPDFSEIMGLPEGNTQGGLIGGRLRPGVKYVELPASPVGNNPGGGIEWILDNPNTDITIELITKWNFNR